MKLENILCNLWFLFTELKIQQHSNFIQKLMAEKKYVKKKSHVCVLMLQAARSGRFAVGKLLARGKLYYFVYEIRMIASFCTLSICSQVNKVLP